MQPRPLLRCARRIAAALEPPPAPDTDLERYLVESIEMITRIRDQHSRRRRAAEHGWKLAAGRIRSHIERDLAAVGDILNRCRIALAPSPRRPSLCEIYAEVTQLADEFAEVRYDGHQRCVIVVTDPITLHETPLGRFEVSLPVAALPRPAAAVRVRALDPNPAGANPEVTHPHVSSERLCCGDGGAPLNSALMSHRLCDAALIVRSILGHYNPDSAYVALEDWHGVPCSECDCTVAEDDAEACQNCSDRFCEDCTRLCSCCDDVTCLSCAGTCESCRERCCEPCLHPCETCEETTCEGCLETGNCPACREQQEEDDAANNEQALLAD